jgi:hypothetical protein
MERGVGTTRLLPYFSYRNFGKLPTDKPCWIVDALTALLYVVKAYGTTSDWNECQGLPNLLAYSSYLLLDQHQAHDKC